MKQNEILPRIVRYLILHTSHRNNLGLLEGKMGIAIFFFHYSIFSDKKIYGNFAEELTGEIYKEIHINFPYNLKNGLAGIAWGIEYLVRHNFVTGDTDAVLEELDKKIMEWDVRRIRDFSLETGLKGLACYIISRCACKKADRKIPDGYIQDLISSCRSNSSKDADSDRIIEKLNAILKHEQIDFDAGFLREMVFRTKIPQKNIFTSERPLGILNNGYAGIGFKIMHEDETKSIHI